MPLKSASIVAFSLVVAGGCARSLPDSDPNPLPPERARREGPVFRRPGEERGAAAPGSAAAADRPAAPDRAGPPGGSPPAPARPVRREPLPASLERLLEQPTPQSVPELLNIATGTPLAGGRRAARYDRLRALYALSELGAAGSAAQDSLVPLSRDPDRALARLAAYAIDRIAGRPFGPTPESPPSDAPPTANRDALRRSLDGKTLSDEGVPDTVRALLRLQPDDPAAIGLLRQALKSTEGFQRPTALVLIDEGYGETAALLDAMFEYDHDDDSGMPLYFLRAPPIFQRFGAAAVPFLVRKLNGPSSSKAYWLLKEIGSRGSSAADKLVPLLEEPEQRRNAATAMILCHCREELAVPILVEALGDPDDAVRQGASRTLRSIYGVHDPKVGPAFRKSLASADGDLKQQLLSILADLDEELIADVGIVDPPLVAHPKYPARGSEWPGHVKACLESAAQTRASAESGADLYPVLERMIDRLAGAGETANAGAAASDENTFESFGPLAKPAVPFLVDAQRESSLGQMRWSPLWRALSIIDPVAPFTLLELGAAEPRPPGVEDLEQHAEQARFRRIVGIEQYALISGDPPASYGYVLVMPLRARKWFVQNDPENGNREVLCTFGERRSGIGETFAVIGMQTKYRLRAGMTLATLPPRAAYTPVLFVTRLGPVPKKG